MPSFDRDTRNYIRKRSKKAWGRKKTSSYECMATVVTNGKIPMVLIDGATTPCEATLEVGMKKGDRVRVHVSNTGVRAEGNQSDPSAGSRSVREVKEYTTYIAQTVSAKFGNFDHLYAKSAEFDELRAEFAAIENLDVDELSAQAANIRNLKVEALRMDSNLTATINSLIGHWEDKVDFYRDEHGELVLDSEGHAIPYYRKTWVADNEDIAAAWKRHTDKYSTVEAGYISLMDVQDILSDAIENIEAGLNVVDDEGKVTVTIGNPDGRTGFAVSDDGLRFVMKDEDGAVIHSAEMNSEAFAIENAEVDSFLKIGMYAFHTRLDGGMTLQWIGG